MTGAVDRGLRGVFDQDAERYDRARPGYPAALFTELTELVGLGTGRRLLEIGAGTGKATLPLAATGCQIIAVELGANLAATCRRNLAAFPRVQVVTAEFETWRLPSQPFDVVTAATAWHWLDPTLRVTKTAQALRPGAMLAVVETHHVAGGDGDEFFAQAQECYERHDLTTTPGLRRPSAYQVPPHADTDASDWFEPAIFRRYQWQTTYSTCGYLDLLMTYSGHRAMPVPGRTRLLDCIADLIDTQHGGEIIKNYLTQLWLARRATTG